MRIKHCASKNQMKIKKVKTEKAAWFEKKNSCEIAVSTTRQLKKQINYCASCQIYLNVYSTREIKRKFILSKLSVIL